MGINKKASINNLHDSVMNDLLRPRSQPFFVWLGPLLCLLLGLPQEQIRMPSPQRPLQLAKMVKSSEDHGNWRLYDDEWLKWHLKTNHFLFVQSNDAYRTPQQIAAQKRLQQTQAQVDEVSWAEFVFPANSNWLFPVLLHSGRRYNENKCRESVRARSKAFGVGRQSWRAAAGRFAVRTASRKAQKKVLVTKFEGNVSVFERCLNDF